MLPYFFYKLKMTQLSKSTRELCSNICTHIMTFGDNVTQVNKVFALENSEGTYSVEVLPAKCLLSDILLLESKSC